MNIIITLIKDGFSILNYNRLSISQKEYIDSIVHYYNAIITVNYIKAEPHVLWRIITCLSKDMDIIIK